MNRAVSCGRRHLPLRVGGRHARVPCGCACARPSWPGQAGRSPGRVLMRLTFSSGRSVFLLCSAPSWLVLPLSWSLVGPPTVFPPLHPPPFFFSSARPPLSLAFFGFRPRVPWALALCFSFPPPRPVVGFFLRPLDLWLSLVSGPGCPGPWHCVLFVWLASHLSALRALSPRLCFLPGRLLLLGGCCPPPPPLVSRGFRRCLPVLLFLFFFSVFAPVVSGFCWFSAWGALGLGAVGFSFVGLPLLRSPCAFASFVCPAMPLAALWWLLPAPPVPFLARCFRRSVLCFLFFFSLSRSFVVSAPAVSGFLWFLVAGALGLGTVCFLFWWPPSSRLAVRSRLFSVSRLALGCSLVVSVPPPLCVLRFSSRPPGPRVLFLFSFF